MGDDIVIRTEGLGKRYTLGGQSNGSYVALRDVVASSVRKLFRRDPQVATTNASDNSFWALKDVSFEIKRGDVVGIIGRNGAGKSTLLKVLSQITEPTKGRIVLTGRVASLLEVGTGFHPELTGRENIFLNGAILGMHRYEIKAKFDEIVAFAEIEQFLDTPVKRYSSGMYVRLAFAVAAHLEPEILIVDEVLAVGDAQFQKKCLGKMGDVASQGRTILFVSHQMGVVASLCGKGILLNAGSTVLIGGVTEVIREYLKLASNAENLYRIDEVKRDTSKNQIISVHVESFTGVASSEFSYSENVCLTIKLALPTQSTSLLLGVGLDNSLQMRVFTVLRETSQFRAKNADGFQVARLILPSNLIAPNSYSFTIAIFEHKGSVHDHVQNVCPIRIMDDGSPYARFDGLNYGDVIVDARWEEASDPLSC